MEYTKDVIFELQYEDKPEKEGSTFKGSFVRRHKWVSLMVTLLVLLTIVDAVLMVQFYEVLKEL